MNGFKNCGKNTDASTLCGLTDSMNKRLVTVVEKKNGLTLITDEIHASTL